MNNYVRFLRDVKYDLLVPPHGIDYSTMSPLTAQEAFDWFISKIPERMAYFRQRCGSDLNINIGNLNYTDESLIPVWKWFIRTARTEKTPETELNIMREGAKIFGESYISKNVLTVATKYIMRDISIYLGECFVRNYSNLFWTFKAKPKNSITVNQPIIAGFIASSNGKKGDLFFAPIHMVEIQATKVLEKSADEKNLFDIYHFWEQYVTGDDFPPHTPDS